jgi:uncharacterized membrane protein YkvA (DUF1232 family)
MPAKRKSGEPEGSPQKAKSTKAKSSASKSTMVRKDRRASKDGGKASKVRPTVLKKKAATEKEPLAELTAQSMRDYTEVKKALGVLWKDVAKTTYSAFNSVASNVEKRYENSRKAISEIDVHYALEKGQSKLKSVGKSTSAVAKTIVKQAGLLYRMLKDMTTGKFKAPWVTVSAITAALLYVISPIDVLPDFIPGAGLIDDALVVSLCMTVIRMDLKRYAKEMDLDLSEYGLAKK